MIKPVELQLYLHEFVYMYMYHDRYHNSHAALVANQDIQVIENGGVQLSCSVVGDTSGLMPLIGWLDPQGMVASISNNLSILSIQRAQAGVYVCTFQSNLYNTTKSTTVTVLCE